MRGAYGPVCLDTRGSPYSLELFGFCYVLWYNQKYRNLALQIDFALYAPWSTDSTFPELLLKGTFMLPFFAQHLAQPFKKDLGFTSVRKQI